MSAPLTDLSTSSISSSGHEDGLGRRSLAFDRESGAMLERLYVRPQLVMFEQVFRRRIEQLQHIDHQGIARPRDVERDPTTGELVVISEFAAGTRLSDLLDTSADAVVVPGVDVALGYLLAGLDALSTLHQTARTTHGLIDPSRTILTADGQVVFVDLAFGPAIERLYLSAGRLWNDFGVGGWSPAEPVRFDATADVTQASLAALMLVLGRNLRHEEYPDALPSLLMEIVEVAQIRGSSGFAGSLQRFFQRSLPLPGRRPFANADEALGELRQIVRRDIGLDACRHAIIDFVAQMDAVFASATEREIAALESAGETTYSDEDAVEESVGHYDAAPIAAPATLEEDEAEDEEELELSLEQLDPPAAPRAAVEDVEEIYDLSSDDVSMSAMTSELASYHEAAREPEPVAATPEPEPEPEQSFEAALAAFDPLPAPVEEPPVAQAAEAIAPAIEEREEAHEPARMQSAGEPAEEAAAADAAADETDAEEAHAEPEGDKQSHSSRRRKRQQQKSARARKDKLRSTTDHKPPPPPPAPPPPPPPPKPASPSGWLVSPHRSAASEMLIPEPAAPAPVRHVPTVPTMPSFSPTPVGPFAQPAYANPAAQASAYGTPSVIKPAPPAPPPPKPVALQAPAATTVKIKAEPPAAASGTRRGHEPVVPSPVDRFSTLSLGGAADETETTRSFPWKLAAVAVAVAALAIVLGRSYLPGRTAVEGEAGARTQSAAPSGEPAPGATPTPAADAPIPAGKGRIAIQSQPSGIRVLLDRKPVGETPVSVDTTPGRHALTFLTSGGEVVQSVRVTAGKVTPFDVPVFSGWLTIVAPFVVDIAREGQSIGTSEQSRLMLPPGRHKVTLSNKELAFSQTQDVDIEPGGVRTVTINPKGTVSINAVPWAEVSLEGAKLGETPLAGIQVPLGTREFVFKNPQFGEKRLTVTVRATPPTTIAHDFTK
jgi:hypothetical protein